MSSPIALFVVGMLMMTTFAPTSQAEPVKINTSALPPAIETWQLHEVWHLGGEDADADEPLLGVVNKGLVDESGHFWLLDSQLAHILEVSPAGEYLQTIGGQGNGPGELQRPQDITLLSDGKIGVLQSYPARIVKLNRDGTPAGSIAVDDPAINYWSLRSAGGTTVVSGQRNDYERKDPTRSATYRFIKSLTAEGLDRHLYLDGTSYTQWQPPVADESKSFFPTSLWDLKSDGTLVIAPQRDLFHLEFVDPAGQTLRIVDRPFAPYQRNRADRQKIADRMSMNSNGKELDVKKIILDTERAINSITAMHDGTIWVETCFGRHDLPEGVFRRYDVLDNEGNLLKEVHLRCEARQDLDGFGLLPDGQFIWIRNLTSAFRSMYPNMPKGDDEEEAEDDDVMLKIVVLQRVPFEK